MAAVDAAFADVTSETLESDDAKAAAKESIAKAAELFTNVAEEDMRKDRSGLLALLELEQRARSHGLSSGIAS